MPQMKPFSVFFGEEWDRFKEGITGLHPGIQTPPRPGPGSDRTITVPGWDSVIKVGPHPEIPPGAWAEYYKAQREGRTAQLDPAINAEIMRLKAMRDANESSTQPAWARSVGQVMTAIDNVQDLASTLATLGRLVLWAAPRLGARAVPFVGAIVLVSDVLNLMNLLGMVAMPMYALLCSGPRDALVAGVPAAVLKTALCRKVWTQAHLNPFSRRARAKRRLNSMGKLPGIGNIIEVAQTADNFFGYGLGLGSLYGMAMETLFAISLNEPGQHIKLNTQPLYVSLGGQYLDKIGRMSAREQVLNRQVAQMMTYAPVIAGKQDLIDDDTHLTHMTALLGAASTMAKFFEGGPHQALMRELAPLDWAAPSALTPSVTASLEGLPRAQWGEGSWWLADNPRTLPGDRLVLELGAEVTRGVGDFLIPRRDRDIAAYYGAIVNQVTDHLWTLFADDDRFLHWELAPDYKLLTGMAVDGRLLPASAPPTAAWRFWLAARALLAERGGKLLDGADLDRLAAAAGVTLLHLLPPDAPWPPQWQAWADAGFPQTPDQQKQTPSTT